MFLMVLNMPQEITYSKINKKKSSRQFSITSYVMVVFGGEYKIMKILWQVHIYLNVSKEDGCDFWQVTAKMNHTLVTNPFPAKLNHALVTNHFPLLERNLTSSRNRIWLTSKTVLNILAIVVKKYVNAVYFASELFMVN